MGYIYKITNTITGSIYIGQTRKTIGERFVSHKKEVNRIHKYGATPLYRDMKKYGKDKFTIESIVYTTNDEELSNLEMYFIKLYGSYRKENKNNYNLTTGGRTAPIIIPKIMPYTLAKIDLKTQEVLKTYYSYEEIYKDYPRVKYGNIIKVSLGYIKTAYGFYWKRSKDIHIVYDPEKRKKHKKPHITHL
jgi:group I intron endonuclease